MIDKWLDPLYKLYGGYGYFYFQSGVPEKVTYALQAVALLSFIVWSLCDRKEYIKKFLCVLLVDYILFLLCSTVIFRPENAETGVKLIPFWKYFAIGNGREQFVLEIVLNILVFIPIGFLASCLSQVKTFLKVILLGLIVSLVIELGQLIFEKGVAEIDDVIHNTFGCSIGYLMAIPIVWIYNLVTKEGRIKDA